MNLTPWAWLLVPLGVCRAMQIVLNDRLLRAPREFAMRRFGSYVRYSLACPWCTSTQIALVVAALLAWDESRQPTLWVLAALSASLVAVAIDRVYDRTPLLADDPDEPPAEPPGVVQVFQTIHGTDTEPPTPEG